MRASRGVAPNLLAACRRTDCDVETVTPYRPAEQLPVAGRTISVRYDNGEDRFLRIRRRYSAAATRLDRHFVSGVIPPTTPVPAKLRALLIVAVVLGLRRRRSVQAARSQ